MSFQKPTALPPQVYLAEAEREAIYKTIYSQFIEVRIAYTPGGNLAVSDHIINWYKPLEAQLRAMNLWCRNLHNLAWVGPREKMDDTDIVWVDVSKVTELQSSSWWFHPSRKDDALLFKLRAGGRV